MATKSRSNQCGRKPQVPAHVIRESASRGLTRKEIAAELRVTYQTVSSMCWHHEIAVTPDHHFKYPPKWFSETVKILTGHHGWTVGRIAGVFEVSPGSVRKYLG